MENDRITSAWLEAGEGMSPAAMLIKHSVLFCDYCKVSKMPSRAEWAARKEAGYPSLSPTKGFVIVYPSHCKTLADAVADDAISRFIAALKRLGAWSDRWVVIADSEDWLHDINGYRSRLGLAEIERV